MQNNYVSKEVDADAASWRSRSRSLKAVMDRP